MTNKRVDESPQFDQYLISDLWLRTSDDKYFELVSMALRERFPVVDLITKSDLACTHEDIASRNTAFAEIAAHMASLKRNSSSQGSASASSQITL